MIHEIVSKKGLMKRLQGKGFSLSVRIGTIADTVDGCVAKTRIE